MIDSHIKNFEEVLNVYENGTKTGSNIVTITFASAIQVIDKGVAKNIYGWRETEYKPEEYKSPVYSIEAKKELEINTIEGPFDIKTGEKISNGISRFKEYHYVVTLNRAIDASERFKVYWGQSLDGSSDIKALLNSSGQNLRGGTLIEGGTKLRVKLRFGEGADRFKVHAYLDNRYNESITLGVPYNKIVGIVAEVNRDMGTGLIELYEVEGTGNITEQLVVEDTIADLGGDTNDARALFYDIKDPSTIILDGIGGAGTGMKKTGGSIRVGTKGKTFSPKYYREIFKNKDGFRGNQYTKVRQLTKIGKTLGIVGSGGTLIIGMIDLHFNYKAEGGFGEKTQQATGSFVGGLAGSFAGAEVGALVGGLVGAGVGAIPGAIIGSILGGWLGGKGATMAVEEIQDHLKEN